MVSVRGTLNVLFVKGVHLNISSRVAICQIRATYIAI